MHTATRVELLTFKKGSYAKLACMYSSYMQRTYIKACIELYNLYDIQLDHRLCIALMDQQGFLAWLERKKKKQWGIWKNPFTFPVSTMMR